MYKSQIIRDGDWSVYSGWVGTDEYNVYLEAQ